MSLFSSLHDLLLVGGELMLDALTLGLALTFLSNLLEILLLVVFKRFRELPEVFPQSLILKGKVI